jgi:hypothetical protein
MAPNVMKQTTERLQTLYESPQGAQAISPEFQKAAHDRLQQLLDESKYGGLAGDALEDEEIQLIQDDYEDIYVDDEGNVQVEASKAENVIYKHKDRHGADFDWLHELVPEVSPPRAREAIEVPVQKTPKKAAQKRRMGEVPKKGGRKPVGATQIPVEEKPKVPEKPKGVVSVKRPASVDQLSQAPSRRQLPVVKKPFLKRASKGETAAPTAQPKALLATMVADLDPAKLAEQNMHVTAHEYRVSPTKVIQVVHATAGAGPSVDDDDVQEPFSMAAPSQSIVDLHEKLRRLKIRQQGQNVLERFAAREAEREDMIKLYDTPSPQPVIELAELSMTDDQPSQSIGELQEKMGRRREQGSPQQYVESPKSVEIPEAIEKPQTSKRQLSSAAPSRRQLPVVKKPFLKRSATSISQTKLVKKKQNK